MCSLVGILNEKDSDDFFLVEIDFGSQSPFSLPWQKEIWQNFALGLWLFEKPKPHPQFLRTHILSENCGFYIHFLIKSWGINVKLINNLPKLIKGYNFFKKRDISKF